jgi:indole-3-glycerol phosphate synthase
VRTVAGIGQDDVLARIMRERKQDVAPARRRLPLKGLLWEAEGRVHHSLVGRLLQGGGCGVVAEVKKASPSAGLLRPDFDPAALALEYAQAGAVGISVLTEPRYFLGSEADLRAVRAVVNLPILRKDFISDPYQLAEARAWGADVILLIAAGLTPERCVTLHQESVELGLEAIVEVHTREELAVAIQCKGAIIGVNSRNLKTLTTNLSVAYDLVESIPDGRLCLAESGIKTGSDLKRLKAAGYDGFLIGESLLRQRSPSEALKALLRASQ